MQIQSTIVPEVVLKEWAQRTYQDAADYWTFRKQVCHFYVWPNLKRVLQTSVPQVCLFEGDFLFFCRVNGVNFVNVI